MAWPAICPAEEIAPFRLTGIDGHVLVDYLNDGLTTGQTGTPGTAEQKQAVLREEIFLMTHSYVYHPNFLTLNIGGGPIRQDSSIDFGGDRTDAGKTLYNFTGRANFLREKPLRGSLFYDHLNPTVSVAPGEIMVQENSRYGFNFSSTSPSPGIPLNLGYVHTQTRGDGAGRILDDQLDQFNFNISNTYGALGSSSLQYQAADLSSRSGNLNLPIQTTSSNNQGLIVNTRLQLGAAREYDLTNNISFSRRQYTLAQDNLPDQNDFSFLLDLRARPSGKLNLFGAYNQNRNDQGSFNLDARSLTGGLSYLPLPDLETNLDIRMEDNDADRYAIRSQVLDGFLRYKRPLWLGNLQVGYGTTYEQRDQNAANPLVRSIDEKHILAGTNTFALNHPHVLQSSVTVSNPTRTQTYIENADYFLIVVGTETRLQRQSSGSIPDGEEVLVNYTYDIGGSYASNQFDQTLNLNWNISRNFDSYFRWLESSPKITSGVATFPLNPVRSVLLGVRAEVTRPAGMPFSAGGSIEMENRDEEISPYKRESGDYFVQTNGPLFGLFNMRFTGRHSRIRYDFSTQDVDLNGYELRLWARRYGIDLNGLANYEQDDGGPIRRSRRDASINAVWRERKVTVTAALVYSHEQQGEFVRDHTIFRLTGRRDF